MLKRFFCAVSAAIVTLAVSNAASAQLSDMKRVHPTIEVLTIAGILTELGASYQISLLEDGTPLITAQAGPGKTVIMVPSRCKVANSSQCYSLIYMTFGSVGQLPYATLAENLVIVNSLNGRLDLAKAYIVTGSGRPAVTASLNSDHGVSRGNIVASLSILLQSSDLFFGELANAKEPSSAASFDALNEAPAISLPNLVKKGLGTSMPLQEATGGAVKSLLQNRAFQAWLGTEDFQRDYTYQISD